MQDSSVHGLSSSVSYNYDIANRLATVNGVAYTYDDNGNLLNDGVNTYTYDSANRLIEASNQSSVNSYQYNGLGDRLSQNGVNYTLDLNSGLTQVLSDGTTSYTYGLGRIAQSSIVNQQSEISYFLGDALGSVRQMTDQAGAITYAAAYDPYGVVTQSGGASQSAYGYTGEQQSDDLVYLRARYVNVSDGRFQSRDTWGGDVNMPMSYNKWNYVDGNPVNRTDPTGKCWYWDPSDGKIKHNPFEGSSSDPCKSFANVMEDIGIHVSSPEEFLKNLPPEIRKELSCKKADNQTYLTSQDPHLGTPENFGSFVTAYSRGSVQGIHTQFGVHFEGAESGSGTSFGLPIPVSASIKYYQ